MTEVTPGMRSAKDDLIRLAALQRHRICKLSIAALTPAKIAEFSDERLTKVGPAR